jgi:hypothetical protein
MERELRSKSGAGPMTADRSIKPLVESLRNVHRQLFAGARSTHEDGEVTFHLDDLPVSRLRHECQLSDRRIVDIHRKTRTLFCMPQRNFERRLESDH